ncbi:MAG: Gfo/Idh/MocA family oxidoreductase [Actinomycetales bacterium]|nr:Gfo/Idh/MocA family oxidoreductase [Actinomycetales bacterium]
MPTTFAIVGSGWRSQFFLRLAQAAPAHLRVTAVATRSAERGEQVSAEWHVPTVRTVAELVATKPDFVIAAVPWGAMPGTVRELVEASVPVLAETPPAPDADGLRSLWGDVGASGLVQVAEQYLLMPGHAARLAVARSGAIGTPTNVQVCSTHMYHATSLIRGFLGAGFDPVTVTARDLVAPLVDPLTPDGWTGDETPKDATQTLAILDFGAGRSGVYDFTSNQWWNPLLSRRIVVRGSAGEIVDDAVTRLVDPVTPITSHLEYRRAGMDLNLEGVDLRTIAFEGEVVYRNPFVRSGLSEDDIAVAELLVQTGAWARDEGPQPYPLAEACQDHLIALAIGQSARERREVVVEREAWAG